MANETARHLRCNKTSAERRLWGKLRALKPLGFKFRQQVPIDHYIVDFACLSKRLIVEVDGAAHSTAEERACDAMREAYLRKQGFRIMRVWNREIFNDVVVMDSIIGVLNTPTPNPSPQGGGEPSFSPPLDGEGSAPEARGWGGATHETVAQEHPQPRPRPARGRGEGGDARRIEAETGGAHLSSYPLSPSSLRWGEGQGEGQDLAPPFRGCPSPQPSPRERGAGVRARVIIGADGPRSVVGWATGRSNRELAETRQITVPLLRPSESTDIFLSAGIPGGYAWLFPKGDVANLGLGVAPAARHRLKPLLDSLHQRLVAEDRVDSAVLGHTGGAIPVGGMLDAAGRRGGATVLLAGDAAGLTNPVTGAGINAAVISGTLAGEAAARICNGDAAAANAYAEELADLFGPSLGRALARRRELMQCYADGGPSPADLARSWIAFPAYWAA